VSRGLGLIGGELDTAVLAAPARSRTCAMGVWEGGGGVEFFFCGPRLLAGPLFDGGRRSRLRRRTASSPCCPACPRTPSFPGGHSCLPWTSQVHCGAGL